MILELIGLGLRLFFGEVGTWLWGAMNGAAAIVVWTAIVQ
jgi:hypothetical protein